MDETFDVTININGEVITRSVAADLSLLEFLQEELGLTGTKFGCGIGVCRACTVAVRNSELAVFNPIIACSTPAHTVDGHEVKTVEGLAENGEIGSLQKAFLDQFAFQCGYCTPGFLMAADILVERLKLSPVAEKDINDTIRDALGDHICRCTGYVKYFESVRKIIVDTPGLTV